MSKYNFEISGLRFFQSVRALLLRALSQYSLPFCVLFSHPAANAQTQAAMSGLGNFTAISTQAWGKATAAHLIERAGFGGTPENIEALAKQSPQAAVDRKSVV